jgi:hypothetical protein
MCRLVTYVRSPGSHRQDFGKETEERDFCITDRWLGIALVPCLRHRTRSSDVKLTISQIQHGNIYPISCIRTTEYCEPVGELFCTSHSANMSVVSVVPTAPVKCSLQAHKPCWNLEDCDDITHVHIRGSLIMPSTCYVCVIILFVCEILCSSGFILCWYKVRSYVDIIVVTTKNSQSKIGSGVHPASYQMDTRGYFPTCKLAGAWSWSLTSN